MLFNGFVILVLFLPVTYVVFWLLRTARARYVWLTLTGCVFYGYWDPRFCLLMAFSTPPRPEVVRAPDRQGRAACGVDRGGGPTGRDRRERADG